MASIEIAIRRKSFIWTITASSNSMQNEELKSKYAAQPMMIPRLDDDGVSV